jgi:hypothetical protein
MMTQTFLIIVVVVAVVGVAISFTTLLWPFSVADELGHAGAWFHHEDEDSLEDRPDGNRDPDIPRPHLRGRG